MKKIILPLAVICIAIVVAFACKKSTPTSSSNTTTPPPSGSTLTLVGGNVGLGTGKMCFDQANTLWTPATCSGVLSFNGTTLTTYASPVISGNNLGSNIAFFNNAIFAYAMPQSVCGGTMGLNVYTSGTWSLNTNQNATGVFFLNKNRNELWFINDTVNGFNIHALKTNNTWYTINCPINFGSTSQIYISKMVSDVNGNVWMCGNYGNSNLGLLKYNGTTWSQYTTANSSLPNDSIIDLDVTSTGLVWLCCPNSLIKFDGTNWTVSTASQMGVSVSSVANRAIAVSPKTNYVYIGTLKVNGVIKYDGANFTQIVSSSTGAGAVYAMGFDSNNNLWVNGNGELFKCSNP
jgi:hypothetical protein